MKKSKRRLFNRVFISVTNNHNLDDRRRALKSALLEKIRVSGFAPQEFWESGLPKNLGWSFDNLDRVVRQCVAAVVVGFPRWAIPGSPSETRLAGEYNHYEGAVALTHGIPVLLIAENGVENRGIVWDGGGKAIAYIPEDATPAWLDGPEFTKRYKAWLRDIAARRDVFLGYCSKSSGTAAKIQLRLQKSGASVQNWEMDFRTGGSILNEIEKARAACACGVFLFSEDDPLDGTKGGAAPRDNVVFEAGYFMSSKGPARCLIIRQGDAKIPADLGGAIYVHLKKGDDVATIEGRLADFLKKNLKRK